MDVEGQIHIKTTIEEIKRINEMSWALQRVEISRSVLAALGIFSFIIS